MDFTWPSREEVFMAITAASVFGALMHQVWTSRMRKPVVEAYREPATGGWESIRLVLRNRSDTPLTVVRCAVPRFSHARIAGHADSTTQNDFGERAPDTSKAEASAGREIALDISAQPAGTTRRMEHSGRTTSAAVATIPLFIKNARHGQRLRLRYRWAGSTRTARLMVYLR